MDKQRQRQIEIAALDYYNSEVSGYSIECNFTHGAEWADEHQNSPWHDLRKNPEDLPKENTWCVIGWKNRATLLSLYVGNKLFVGDQSGMTEIWMEIPGFKK